MSILIRLSPQKFRWKIRYSILIIIWLCMLFSFLDRMFITVALPFIGDDFGIKPGNQGLLISAFFMGFAFFQIPSGWLVDKFGVKKMLSFSVTIRSVFSTLLGIAPSFSFLLGARFLYGISQACQTPACMKGISTYFPINKRGTANAFVLSVNALGPAIAIFISGPALNIFSWRTVFILLGLPSLLLGLFIWLKYKDNPNIHLNIERQDYKNAKSFSNSANTAEISHYQFFSKPVLWQLVIIFFFFDITYWGFMSWIPSYLINERNFSLMDAGIYGALPFFLGTVTMNLGGYLRDIFNAKAKWIFTLSSFLGGLSLYLMYQSSSAIFLIFYQCGAACFIFLAFGIFASLQINSIPTHLMGVGASIISTAGQLAGVLAPVTMGYSIEITGTYSAAFIFIALTFIISGLVMLLVQPIKTSNRQKGSSTLKEAAP